MKADCACKPPRSCSLCAESTPEWNSSSVKTVIFERTSASCSFPDACEQAILCIDCGKRFKLVERPLFPALRCEGHTEMQEVQNWPPLSGLHLIRDFIDDNMVAKYFDSRAESLWKDSHGGRRKLDFGPQANFKKKKVKIGDFRGFDPETRCLIDAVKCAPCFSTPFRVVEISTLDYNPEKGANLDPHVDDEWIWGERVAGISMMNDSVISFLSMLSPDSPVFEVFVPLPRNSLFVIEGHARHKWLHGFRTQGLPFQRVSVTMRELNQQFCIENPDAADAIHLVADTVFS